MTPVTQAGTAMACSHGDKHKEVTISTGTPSESSLAAMQMYERRCLFCVVLFVTGPNAQQEMKTTTKMALKVTFQKCVGRRKTLCLTS